MKLFGKEILRKKKATAPGTLYDFAQHGFVGENVLTDYVQIVSSDEDLVRANEKAAAKKKKEQSTAISPVNLHKLGTLNQPEMQINCDPEYVRKEVLVLDRKLNLVRDADSGPNMYAKKEMYSMVERLKARLRYEEFEHVFGEYAYTTSAAIKEVVGSHSNLRLNEASKFIPDFPTDAVEAMNAYREATLALTGKNPVFYVIADKKDFGEVTRRRDPILLAQSPFGFVWQILGAWDEEMIYLGDL